MKLYLGGQLVNMVVCSEAVEEFQLFEGDSIDLKMAYKIHKFSDNIDKINTLKNPKNAELIERYYGDT